MIREKSSILGSKSQVVVIHYSTLPSLKYSVGNDFGVI